MVGFIVDLMALEMPSIGRFARIWIAGTIYIEIGFCGGYLVLLGWRCFDGVVCGNVGDVV